VLDAPACGLLGVLRGFGAGLIFLSGLSFSGSLDLFGLGAEMVFAFCTGMSAASIGPRRAGFCATVFVIKYSNVAMSKEVKTLVI
jgi:hypothetical protein